MMIAIVGVYQHSYDTTRPTYDLFKWKNVWMMNTSNQHGIAPARKLSRNLYDAGCLPPGTREKEVLIRSVYEYSSYADRFDLQCSAKLESKRILR